MEKMQIGKLNEYVNNLRSRELFIITIDMVVYILYSKWFDNCVKHEKMSNKVQTNVALFGQSKKYNFAMQKQQLLLAT